MQIIKEIKEAEKQAKQIVADAEKQASQMLEDAKKERLSSLEDRKMTRRTAIDSSVESAEKQAKAEADKINADSTQACQQLEDGNDLVVDKAVDMVIGYIKELPKK